MIGGHAINTAEIGGGPPLSLFINPTVKSWIDTIVPSPALIPARSLVGQRTCAPNVSRETMAPAHASVVYTVGKRTC